jgi:hypothetical protein
LAAGTYYIVVDGWQNARGAYDLLVSGAGITLTRDILPGYSINAYPNPFNEDLNIEVILEKPNSLEIEIMDALGRVLWVASRS